jgi:hypothetical protein
VVVGVDGGEVSASGEAIVASVGGGATGVWWVALDLCALMLTCFELVGGVLLCQTDDDRFAFLQSAKTADDHMSF